MAMSMVGSTLDQLCSVGPEEGAGRLAVLGWAVTASMEPLGWAMSDTLCLGGLSQISSMCVGCALGGLWIGVVLINYVIAAVVKQKK